MGKNEQKLTVKLQNAGHSEPDFFCSSRLGSIDNICLRKNSEIEQINKIYTLCKDNFYNIISLLIITL